MALSDGLDIKLNSAVRQIKYSNAGWAIDVIGDTDLNLMCSSLFFQI